jgi:hypothetical protein
MNDDQVLTGYTLDVNVGPLAPGSAEGRAVLAAYFHEVVSRHHGREATAAEVAAAMRAEPSEDLRPPVVCSCWPARTGGSSAARGWACCLRGQVRSPAFSSFRRRAAAAWASTCWTR